MFFDLQGSSATIGDKLSSLNRVSVLYYMHLLHYTDYFPCQFGHPLDLYLPNMLTHRKILTSPLLKSLFEFYQSCTALLPTKSIAT